jgi:hypothetical protein
MVPLFVPEKPIRKKIQMADSRPPQKIVKKQHHSARAKETQRAMQKIKEAAPKTAYTHTQGAVSTVPVVGKRSLSITPAVQPQESTVNDKEVVEPAELPVEESILQADSVDYYMGSSVKEYLETLDTETRDLLVKDLERTGNVGELKQLEPLEGNDLLEEIEGPDIDMSAILAGPDASTLNWPVLLSALSLISLAALVLFHFVKRHVSRLQKVREAYEVSVQAIGYGSKPLISQYEILGCSEEDSNTDIKARYKHLVKVFHVDTLSGQDLPEELVELSTERFRKIQDAYDTLKEERGIQ